MDQPSPRSNPVVEAAQKLGGVGNGGLARLAEAAQVTPQCVSRWHRTGRIPPKNAPAIAEKTGISVERLCPDFPWPARA